MGKPSASRGASEGTRSSRMRTFPFLRPERLEQEVASVHGLWRTRHLKQGGREDYVATRGRRFGRSRKEC